MITQLNAWSTAAPVSRTSSETTWDVRGNILPIPIATTKEITNTEETVRVSNITTKNNTSKETSTFTARATSAETASIPFSINPSWKTFVDVSTSERRCERERETTG